GICKSSLMRASHSRCSLILRAPPSAGAATTLERVGGQATCHPISRLLHPSRRPGHLPTTPTRVLRPLPSPSTRGLTRPPTREPRRSSGGRAYSPRPAAL